MSSVIIVGVGPGIGSSVARRFAREGFTVGVVARSRSTVDAVLAQVPDARGVTADATDDPGLRAALDELTGALGVPDALVYNAAIIRTDAIGDLSSETHLDAYAVNVVGAITTAAHLLPAMAQRGSGTFLVTGGMPQPDPGLVSLSLGKAGVRGLVSLLDTRFAASGVRSATVTVCGPVAPGTAFDPDQIAEHYWRLATTPPGAWSTEVVYAGT